MSAIIKGKKWDLEEYSQWQNDTWEKINIDKQSCYLNIVGSNFLVIIEGVSVISLCLLGRYGKIEPFYVNNYIGIRVTDKSGDVSKFRIRFADQFGHETGVANCLEVVEELQKFVPVTQYYSHKEENPKDIWTKNLHEVVNDLFLGTDCEKESFESIVKEDVIKETVHNCLLDPQFPALVDKVWNFLLGNKTFN